MILGVDEVGRGVWAGPLVVGAVVLGGAEIDGLTDSKKLTKKRREQLYDEIYAQACGVGLGWVSAAEIDEIGLSEALRLATKRAVQAVDCSFHEIILDGTVNFLRDTSLEPHVTLMAKADLLVPSVSAASIVAKVARDRYMAEQDAEYPGYNFKAHAGYGTAAHRAAIAKHGVTPLHRLSIAPLAKYRTSEQLVESPSAPGHTRLRRLFVRSTSLSSAELDQGLKQSSMIQEVERPNSGQPHNAPARLDDSMLTTRTIGDRSETAAAEELVRRGHEIIARNWKTKYCEIDIVSHKNDCYYFTEVKHRKNARSGDGLAAITPKKLAQMNYAARFYAHTQKLAGSDLQLLAVATTGEPPIVTDLVAIT